jgi:hypothetical protein
VSALKINDDDYPEAAEKHVRDSVALHEAHRHDGACYLAGYVVECCLKAVLLHDKAWRHTPAPHHDASALASERNKISKRPFGHDLVALMLGTIGAVGARYMPDIPKDASILSSPAMGGGWTETIRYRAPHPQAEARAKSWLEWAKHVYESTIVEMRLDGVL